MEKIAIAFAIVVAGVLVALAIALAPTPGRFRFEERDDGKIRYDTATGEIRLCQDKVKVKDPCWTYDWED